MRRLLTIVQKNTSDFFNASTYFGIFALFNANYIRNMWNIDRVRKEFGELFMKSNQTIIYDLDTMSEKFATVYFGHLPYVNSLAFSYVEAHKIGFSKTCQSDDGMTECSNDIAIKSTCFEDADKLQWFREEVDIKKTLDNVIKAYPDCYSYMIREGDYDEIILLHDSFIYYGLNFLTDTPGLPKKILDCVVMKEFRPNVKWVLRNNHGNIVTKEMVVHPKGNIEDNYNDGFMEIDKKINNIINGEDSSIIILHGKPGTGKSCYIRDLISNNKELEFYWLDSSMFAIINTAEFVEFISSCKSSVFILEDSEMLLESRNNGKNPAIQSLLNISDGILGDSLMLKFICTFNTDLVNIDEAILRKGRLKLKYEFTDLKKDKVAKIFRSLGIDESNAVDMPLCDVYNFNNENGSPKKTKKIGF